LLIEVEKGYGDIASKNPLHPYE